MNNIILTLDRGYYSKSNIETIIKSYNSFIMPIPKRVSWQYAEIDSVKTKLNSVKASVEVENGNGVLQTIYCVRKVINQDGRRLYLYVIYNPQVRSDHEIKFRELMRNCYKELLDNKLNESHANYYDKYFSVSDTPKRGRKIIEKVSLEEEFNKKYAGYWCLLSNEKKERSEIYETYSQRNTAEIFYDMVKNDLNGDRVRSHNNKTFEGKMFVTFIALIILSNFKRKFARVRSGNTTLNRVKCYKEVLFKMSSLTKVSFTGKYKPMYAKPTKFQQEIIEKFNISWPL
jgi:transposase